MLGKIKKIKRIKKWTSPEDMSDSLSVMILITLSGGFQDAYTYWERGQVFANAQTGNFVLMSGYAFSGQWDLLLRYFIPVFFFAMGIFLCEFLRDKFSNITNLHWRQWILIVEITLLFIVGWMPASLNFEANAMVSLACAMQVQSFRYFKGHPYASTMCIGNLRSGMDALTSWAISKDPRKLKTSFQYFRVIGIFATGAGVGSRLGRAFGLRSIWFSCFLLIVCILLIEKRASHYKKEKSPQV